MDSENKPYQTMGRLAPCLEMLRLGPFGKTYMHHRMSSGSGQQGGGMAGLTGQGEVLRMNRPIDCNRDRSQTGRGDSNGKGNRVLSHPG